MKENGSFFASIGAGVVLAVLVAAALTLSYPAARSVPTTITAESSQTATQQVTTAVSSVATVTSTAVASITLPATEATTTILSSTVMLSTATAIASTTAGCSAPGVQCGSFQIVSAVLTSSAGATGSGNLTLALMNTGNVEIGSFEVFLNSSSHVASLLGALAPGQQTTVSITIQNAQFQVVPGQAYTVLVEGFLISDGHITANLWGSVEVVASSGSTGTTTTSYTGSTLSCSGNCTFNLPWPIYQTLGDLKNASPFVVVANVSSASVTSVDGVPVTAYQLSVITNIEGPGVNKSAGMTTLPMAQIGGTANGTTVSVQGYPTLSVGSTYVLFLNGPGSLYPAYYGGYLTSVGGPQGTFLVQRGQVYSLDTLYPHVDAWLSVKADGVPLSQFISEVQGS